MKLEKFKEKNKKKTLVIVFSIFCVFLVTIVFLSKSFALFETQENFNFITGNVEDPGDLYFAYYIDDQITLDMPAKDSGYTLSSKSSCTNGVSVSWKDDTWSAIVNYSEYKEENSSRTKCTLYFEEKLISPSDAVKDYIIANAPEGTIIEDDGTPDHNLRYVGKSPNNYVYFNCEDNENPTEETCEKWRVIGVMNNIDDGTGNLETRLKIIRNESIGNYSWDSSPSAVNSGSGINEWSQADAMKLMNPGYEDNIHFDNHNNEILTNNSLYWSRQNGICYNGQKNATVTCDFSESGLKEAAKSFISESVWGTGSNGMEVENGNISTSKFYELERGENNGKICSTDTYCNDTIERETIWTGFVGLMYPSDYGYATSGGSTYNRETCLNTALFHWNSNMSDCKNNNWLYKLSTTQWTINPSASSLQAFEIFVVTDIGGVSDSSAWAAASLLPTLYLNSNVQIINGEGTIDSPFILSFVE